MRACCQMVRPCDLVIITSLRSLVNSSVNMALPAFAAELPAPAAVDQYLLLQALSSKPAA